MASANFDGRKAPQPEMIDAPPQNSRRRIAHLPKTKLLGYSVKLCWSTTWPPWTMVISAVANCTSVMLADQFEFGQPASAAVGAGGGVVVTQALRFPFFISVDGMVAVPLGETGVLF